MTLPALILLASAAVLSAGCAYDFPRPKIYQVEEAVDIFEGQAGDRFAAHRACVKTQPEIAALLDCMRVAGYEFVASGPDYPASECWQLRERGGDDLPQAYCFERVASGTPAP